MENIEKRKLRNQAVSISLDMDESDKVVELLSRPSGLFSITTKKIIRIRSPDDLDPELNHDTAPWEQSLFLPHGSSDPIVARTIIQTAKLAGIFFAKSSEKYLTMSDISWEVMNSLVSLRFIRNRIEKQIESIMDVIENDMDSYTKGNSPKPLPIVEYFDIEFRSFINEVRRALSAISGLFLPLTQQDFSGGKFDKAYIWALQNYGEDGPLTFALKGELPWIKLWIDVRNAIEHPAENRFVEMLNFSLEANRGIRLPTWRFIHPDYDMAKPQNLLEAFENCINNILLLFEDLQIALVDGHLPSNMKVFIEFIPKEDRDILLPLRYKFHPRLKSI